MEARTSVFVQYGAASACPGVGGGAAGSKQRTTSVREVLLAQRGKKPVVFFFEKAENHLCLSTLWWQFVRSGWWHLRMNLILFTINLAEEQHRELSEKRTTARSGSSSVQHACNSFRTFFGLGGSRRAQAVRHAGAVLGWKSLRQWFAL